MSGTFSEPPKVVLVVAPNVGVERQDAARLATGKIPSNVPSVRKAVTPAIADNDEATTACRRSCQYINKIV